MDYPDRPEPTEREKAHVRKLSKLVDDARTDARPREANFQKWRAGYKGRRTDETGNESAYRINLAYSNIAAIMPQVYAKNPDISFAPREGVPPKKYELIKGFAKTGEVIVRQQLLDAGLKRRAKWMTRSAMVTCVGWWKVAWQETKKRDPLMVTRANDIQDNLERIRTLSKQVADDSGTDREVQEKELQDQLTALEQSPEITLAKGIAIDPVLAEDILILDRTIRGADDYVRADRIAHRIWMSCEAFYDTMGFKPEKAKVYSKIGGESGGGALKPEQHQMYCCWEIWDKSANTVYTIVEGEDGYARPPYVPQAIGERWYPFFALQFNPVDGEFYGLSDVELLDKLVEEYNRTRDDLAKHREENLPVRLAKKGGNLTEEDGQKIQNRKSGDLIWVNGVPGKSLSDDIAELPGIAIDIANYDTGPIRADMEMLLGGGDAVRGSILKAKTATEAEIMAQGLRSRTEERQDTIEDVLSDVAKYVFEICLLEISLQDAIAIAGPAAVWPTMSREEAYGLVNIEIKAGTTGKPNKLQEQDRWLELLPIMQEAMLKVVELRAMGQNDMADAITELVRETFRRFDERIDVDKFIPPQEIAGDIEAMPPEMAKAKLAQAMQLISQMQAHIAQMEDASGNEEAKEVRQHERAKEMEEIKTSRGGTGRPALPAPDGVMQPDASQVAPMVAASNAELAVAMSAQMQRMAQTIIAAMAPPLAPPLAPPITVSPGAVPPKTKRVVLRAPDGGEYVGVLDETGVQVRAPSGRIYSGAVSELH